MPRIALQAASLFLFALSLPMAFAQAGPRPMGKFTMPATVQGRFDHLGIDAKGGRLFVAAETVHQVLVFDLNSGKYVRSIDNIQIPHAIFVREDLNRIFITDGGAGAVKVYDGKSYALIATIPLKVDSDSIAYDPATHFLYVDNGGGDAHERFSMLSVIDTTHNAKVADIKVEGDTLEAIALDPASSTMYVNNAARNEITVIDRRTRAIVGSWPVTLGKRNVAMALDPATHRLFVGTRSGTIVVFDTQTHKELTSLPIGKGVDDLAFDAATKRIYAPCGGDGLIYVYAQQSPDRYTLVAKVPSGPGGKNELLDAAKERLYVIVPPAGSAPGVVDAYALR